MPITIGISRGYPENLKQKAVGNQGLRLSGYVLGFLVPGVVTTPIDALSSPAAIAIRIRTQNASSMYE
jgi:hypothetical protein